jgi:hypothetical protein
VRAEHEVQEAFERARASVERGERGTLGQVEEELWSALLALGRALVTLFLARQAMRPRVATYEHDGVRYALDVQTRRTSDVGTRLRRGQRAELLRELTER